MANTISEWIRCPVCGGKTRDRIREDTVLKNYPLYRFISYKAIDGFNRSNNLEI